MTTEQAIIHAAGVLGMAETQLFRAGYRDIAEKCAKAIEHLRDRNDYPREPRWLAIDKARERRWAQS